MNATETRIMAERVQARNLVNSKSNQVSKRIQEILFDFREKKIVNSTPYWTWSKKVKDRMSAFQDELQAEKFRLVFVFSEHGVWGTLDTTFPVSDCAVEYVKAEIPICTLSDCCLESVGAPLDRRTDYTLTEVLSVMSKISRLEDEVRFLKNQIREFQ